MERDKQHVVYQNIKHLNYYEQVTMIITKIS